ncbi:MAG: peptidoglycan DD-metalloendopeptidase family protein, partial [Patescibacteria group bacterium]
IKIEGENYTATIMPIPYETRIVSKKGNISSSLYEAALEKEIDERAIIALADAFQWSIDFAMDPRVGDTFKFIYEEKYLDDEYIRPGKILAGKYVNSGKEYYVFYFDGEKDNEGYFDEEGNSVQKLFLKAPVAFKYISSGFTTGLRYVEAFNVSTGHRAIDYAAPSGTPIRSVGDGTITMAGWNGSYGYMVSVRHNGTYSTNYAHMSKMAVKKGAKVKQGDIIGYVGSTGFSTGPHLHYEMVKNGIKINPLTEVLPPGKSLNEEIKIIFLEKIKEYKEDLNKN